MVKQELFSQAEAARYCGMSRRTIQRADRRGVLPSEGRGKMKRYRRSDLDGLPERLSACTVSHRQSPSVAHS